MKKISNQKLMKIKGGFWPKFALISGGIIFVIGVIDGFVRPLRCN